MRDPEIRNIVFIPNRILFGLLFMVDAWTFTLFDFLVGQRPGRRMIAASISIVATLALLAISRQTMLRLKTTANETRIGVTGIQVVWILIAFIAGGALIAMLFAEAGV